MESPRGDSASPNDMPGPGPEAIAAGGSQPSAGHALGLPGGEGRGTAGLPRSGPAARGLPPRRAGKPGSLGELLDLAAERGVADLLRGEYGDLVWDGELAEVLPTGQHALP